MKHIPMLLLISFMLVSCGSTKEITTPKTPNTPTVSSGTKVATTKPVRDMATVIPNENVTPKEVKQVPPPSMGSPDNPKYTQLFDHSGFDGLLQKNVSAKGNVSYIQFKKDRTVLRMYIAALGKKMPQDSWSKEEKLAYWMNAYNAMTLDLIIRNMPLESIKDIKDPWDQRLWKLGDKWYNLNEIEHDILRKMEDPRIHFGINCASFSCPPLLNEAFTSQKVDAQLTMLSKQFINDPLRNTITAERVDISKIFNWFSKDFKQNGSLIDFLNRYSNTTIHNKAKVRFKEYDWSLNK